MKNILLKLLMCMAFAGSVSAADVTVSDSIVSLASSRTKNFVFTDPATSQSVTIAVTMSPYSTTPGETFSILDDGTRCGVGADGDGNWFEVTEGADFSASVVSASEGVTASSIQFAISALGIRCDGVDFSWASTAGSFTFSQNVEAAHTLDSNLVSLNGTTYSGQLRSAGGIYQLSDYDVLAGKSLVLKASFTATATVTNSVADPYTTSWLTTYSGRYARIVETDAQLAAGTSETTWSRNSVAQVLPAYCGVQEIYSSTNWVYIRTTGLGSHLMGPWYNDAARTTLFVNIPANQKALVRFPRSPTVPETKMRVGGEIGYFVDGVNMFDSTDATSYSTASGKDGDPPGTPNGLTGDGMWNRDAYVNEAITFDKTLAHQQNTGVYHYHANPIGPRYLLGDHISFDSVTKSYSESTNAPTHHSPIIGWIKDGFPLYGPYGYSNPTNANSGVRRMISGYVPRDGDFGTTNLAATGRTTLPAWAARAYNVSATLASNRYGPNVSTSFPLGRYIEDNDFLGDLGYTQGVDYDLDQYNGRFCVTPEFPNGTYAYFVTITSNGLPAFPYNVGRSYYGNPTGGAVTTVTETVTTNFLGGVNAELRLKTPVVSNSLLTLVWSATEGGTYRVESTTNLTTWTTNSTNVSAVLNSASFTNSISAPNNMFRVTRTALANYDPVSGSASGSVLVAPGGSAPRGSTNTILITLPTNPPLPPANVVPVSITLGGISGTSVSRPSQATAQATFIIPAGAAIGAQNIVVTFSPGPAYTMTGAFTITN